MLAQHSLHHAKSSSEHSVKPESPAIVFCSFFLSLVFEFRGSSTSRIALDCLWYCRFAFPALKPPEPFKVAKTATLVQEVGDTTAAEVPYCFLIFTQQSGTAPLISKSYFCKMLCCCMINTNTDVHAALFSQASQATQLVHAFNMSRPCCLRSKQQAIDTA